MKWTAKLMAHLWRGLLRSRLQAELPAGIERGKAMNCRSLLLLIPFLACPQLSGQEQNTPPALEWKASVRLVDCIGPTDRQGRRWSAVEFDDSAWATVTLPHGNSRSFAGDLFYRGTFYADSLPGSLRMSFASDDGLRLFVNGSFVGQWGPGCHRGGCVNLRPNCGAEVVPPLDIARYLRTGRNVIAAHVSNCNCQGGMSFNASFMKWLRSPFLRDCAGPRGWTSFGFDDSSWTPVVVPLDISVPQSSDMFLRSTVHLPGFPTRVVARFSSDDGIWVYINERFVGHWGGGCHRGGCVNACGHGARAPVDVTEFMVSGANLLVVHVSNGPGNGYFDFSLVSTFRRFLRGDSNDDGEVDIADALCTLEWLFLGSKAPRCIAAANTNGDEAVDIADVVYSLWFSFLGGPPPVPPYPDCGLGTSPTDVETCNRQPRSCPR